MKNSIFNAVCKTRYLALLVVSILTCGNAWGADQTATWTATSGGLGSGIGSGTITDNKSNSWSYTRTLSSGSSYTGWTSNCIQLGKNGGVEHLTLTTSDIPGTIKSVSVECASYQGRHNVSITVGSTTYLASTATSSWTTVGTKTGTGTSSGTITISFTGGTRALYIKSISVTYNNDGGGGTTYTVEYADGITGGSVQASSTSGISANTEITLTPTANNGYEFTSWDVYKKGESSTKVTVTNNKFSMPAYNVVVNATFSCVTPTWSPNLVTETVNYTTGGSATALTVAATANNATVNYQWQTSTDNTNWSNTGSNSSSNTSLTPPTAAAGTTYYRCIATNAASGCSATTTSNVTTVTVSAPVAATITLNNYDGDATTTGYHSGDSFTLPNTNNATCNGKTFVGWSTVAIPTPGSKPNANYYEKGASVTLAASNTFYAVFAEESGSGTTSSSISSYADGTYYMIDSHTYNETTTYYSPSGTSTSTISSVEVTNIVSESDGVLTLDLTSNLLVNAMKYTITEIEGEPNTYTIYNATNDNYIGASTSTSFTNTNANKWELITSNKRFMFWYDQSTDRAVLYQHSYNGNGNVQTYGKRFGCYAKGNAGKTNLNNNKEQYGSGYFFLVPAASVSYSNYTTSCACTAPDYVTVTGRWDRFGGETISLTATAYDDGGNEISAGITSRQWQKLVNSTWTNVTGENVSGATSANLQIINCTKDNSGKYRCVISTGTNCSTASATATDGTEGYGVKVYTLDCYNGGTTSHNFTRVGDTDAGIVTVNLSANTSYEFEVVGDNDYYGNTGTINEDVTNWEMTSGAGHLYINSGLGGTFTFSMDYGTGGNNSTRGIPELSVTYPRKTIYFTPGVWDKDNDKFAIYYFRKVGETVYGNGWTGFIAANDCGSSTEIPQWNGVKIDVVRLKSTCTSPNWSDKDNQTNDITITSNNYISITGWNESDYTYGTYSIPTYTISYDKGTNGTGTRADDSKTCGVAFTLPSTQVFSRNGYTMDGWSVNANGSTKDYNLGGNYTTNAAQIFYPHWTEATYGVTLNTNGGTINAGNVTTYIYGTGATLPTDVTKSHATFQGWYAASNFSGDRVYGIGAAEYGNKEYWAKWESITYTVTWKANGAVVRTDASVVEGDKVASVPSAPSNLTTGSNGCDAEFVGWVIEANDPGALSISVRDTPPNGMFTHVAGSPTITANTTFVAIYRQEQ